MRTLLLILLLAFLPYTGSQAATIDLYEGEAVVESNEPGARRRALPKALEHVFQKISGLRSFEDYPLLEPTLVNASSILLSFYYRTVTVVMADGTEVDELRLVAEFSQAKVDEMASSLQLPRWPVEREPLDIWVVVDDGLDRRILPLEFAYVWKSMADAAEWRGLPANLPVPDDEGVFAIDAQLLWGGYTEDLGLQKGTGAMIAAARREGLEWSVRSNVAYGEEHWTWRVQDIDLQAALMESLELAIDFVATSNAIAASDLGIWNHQLTLSGMSNAGRYEQCLALLQNISVVNKVSVVSAGAGRVTFSLELNALPQYLEEALESSGVLQADENEESYVCRP
jgi:hypothetical protein